MTRPLTVPILLFADALIVGLLVVVGSVTYIPPAVPSCQTPAANWATLVACRTETAQAQTGTPTPRVVIQTQAPQATPTRIEPQRVYCRAGSVTVTPVAPGRELVICQEWTP